MIVNRVGEINAFYSRVNSEYNVVEMAYGFDPENASIQAEPEMFLDEEQAYALASTLKRLADDLREKRMRKEYPLPPIDMEFEASVTQWRIVLGKNPSLVATREFGEWAVKHVKALAVMATGYENDTANVKRARITAAERKP